MPQANRRINTSVFQPFGTDRVEFRVGEQSMAVSQLEALNLLRRLAHHFGVDVPANAVVRMVESQRLTEFMQADAAQEVPYSSPLTREIKWGVPA